MSQALADLEATGARLLRRHVEIDDESTLHDTYEFGRAALANGLGVIDMAQLLWRVVRDVWPAAERDARVARRIEGFLLECLSAFEMAHRGAREANEALRRIEERREEQMRRIARELHDQAGQLLAGVYLTLHTLQPHLAAGGREPFARVLDLLHQVEDEIRRVAHELRPVILDDLGLLPALRFLGEGVTRRAGVTVRVSGMIDGRLPPKVETELYRIAQEALSNVARHAGATTADVEVVHTEREVKFTIRDDGRGFDPVTRNDSGKPRGLGLDSIRERVRSVGGALEIRSRPGVGTEFLIRVPMEVAHAHAHSDRG